MTNAQQPIQQVFGLAIGHHQAGRLPEAEALYREILDRQPAHADAMHLLGVIAYQVGQHAAAAQLIRRAIALAPEYPADAYCNLGSALFSAGQLDEAIAAYRQAIALQPDRAEIHKNLGNALRTKGQLDEAILACRQAIALKPDYADAHNNLGNALCDKGQLDEAITAYHQAIELEPSLSDAHNNLGNALKGKGRLNEAIAAYRQAIALRPGDPGAHNNLGIALCHKGQLDEAIAAYRQAISLAFNFPGAHNNLGNALFDRGQLDEAITAYRQAIELEPNLPDAHNNLGNALLAKGQLNPAISAYRRAIALNPSIPAAHNNLGNALRDQGELDQAVAAYRRALELKADYPAAISALVHGLQHLSQWEGIAGLSQRLIKMVNRDTEALGIDPVVPFSFIALPTSTTAAQQLRCATAWTDRQLRMASEFGRQRAWNPDSGPRSKLTIGYLSADFRMHPLAYLMAELFEVHDHDRFRVNGYSYGPDDESPIRQRLRNAFDQFIELRGASFEESAQRIVTDHVDILIDLTGYTKGARTPILALRPAPIQVNYLGYPGTMGASFMDYILVDDFVVPLEQQRFFTEKLVHLPGCYLVSDSQREVAQTLPTRAECGLPDKGFVFCCFNNNYKIIPDVFDVWMRLLREVQGSVLWLVEGNRFAPANLRREAESRGVAAERLVFAPRLPLVAHLARYRLADLFLDTLPYNAHTTASDALWMGCPVLTIAGKTFVSRVAGSLLRALNLPELVTTSLANYEAMALRLARNAGLLSEVRARLEANRSTSPLFDAGQFARNLEKAYLTMWEIHSSGGKPRAFSVAAT